MALVQGLNHIFVNAIFFTVVDSKNTDFQRGHEFYNRPENT
jgi:hypothetical protein